MLICSDYSGPRRNSLRLFRIHRGVNLWRILRRRRNSLAGLQMRVRVKL